MERYASNLKMKEIKRLVSEKQFMKAMDILDTLNVDKIRSISDLSVIAEVLISNEHYDDAMEILLRIFEKSCTRRIVEQLIELSIKMKNLEEVEEYYKEYLRIAPRDPYRYVLKYRIQKAKQAPFDERIETLETLKQEDYMEEWGYELAKLYHKTGQVDKCVEECSDIILWFGKGIIVEKAKLLKEHYTSGLNIADTLKPGEFDATRSLEEVIRQVKQQCSGVSEQPEEEKISANDIDSTVSDSKQYNNDALYLNSENAANKVGLDSNYLEKVYEDNKAELESNEPVVEKIDFGSKTQIDEITENVSEQKDSVEVVAEEEKETNNQEIVAEGRSEQDYVLTPDIIKQVKEMVSATKQEVDAETVPTQTEDVVLKLDAVKIEANKEEINLVVQAEAQEEVQDKAQVELQEEVQDKAQVELQEEVQDKAQAELQEEVQEEVHEDVQDGQQTEVQTETQNIVDSHDEAQLQELEDTQPDNQKKSKEIKDAETSAALAAQVQAMFAEKTDSQSDEQKVKNDVKSIEHALTDDELKKMKERIQQLQTNDVVKTYRHDEDEIVEENGNTYAYGVNLNPIFQNFIENASIKNQLLSILRNMDDNKLCNHFLICGDLQTGKTSLARAIAITMWKLNRIPSKKVAKIQASKLNKIDLLAKMEPLENGSLIIENAGMLETTTIRSIIKMIEQYKGNILVFFEDQTRNMEELLAREEALRTFFTHRIILPRYDSNDLIGFAYCMVKQQEYEIDENAIDYFEAKVEQIGRLTQSQEQLVKLEEYIITLTQKAETRNMLLLMKQAKEGKFVAKVKNVILVEDIID